MSDINRLRQNALMQNYGLNMGGMLPSIQMPQTGPYNPSGPQQSRPSSESSREPSKSTVPTSTKGKYEPTSSGIEELVGMTNRIYTPETRAGNRYNDLLDNPPEMNKPGLARALVAGGMAFGSNAKGKDMLDMQGAYMYAPYLRDKMEFETKAKPFYDAASLENTANINERTLAGNLATNYTTMEKNRLANEQAAEKNAEIARNNDLKYELGRQKNEILRAEQEGAEFNFDGESVIATRKDGTTWDTGVPTTAWSPYELEERRQRGRMALEGARGANDLAVEGARGANNLAVQGSRNAGTAEAARIRGPVGGSAATTYDPKDEEGRLQQFLQRIYQTDPGAKDAIQFKNGVYSMMPKPPAKTGTILSGAVNDNSAAVANWNRINKQVFGEPGSGGAPYTPTPIGRSSTTTPVTPNATFNAPTQPSAPAQQPSNAAEQHRQDVEGGLSFYVKDLKTGQIVGTVKKDDKARIEAITRSGTHQVEVR